MMRLTVSVASRVCRVEKTRWPGLGGEQRGLDRLVVAHLADQDDVGVLAEGGAQGAGEGVGVDVDLALVDDRLLVAVEELDRVLDRDHVLGAGRVDVVDHRRQAGRLARAGGAGAEDQAAPLLADPLEHRRQHQLADALDARRDDAEHQAHRAALLEDVAAEAAEPGHRVGDVELELLLEALLLAGVHHRERHRDGVLLHQPLELAERQQVAVDADHRVAPDLEMEVGGLALHRDLQQVVDVHLREPPPAPGRVVTTDTTYGLGRGGRRRSASTRA